MTEFCCMNLIPKLGKELPKSNTQSNSHYLNKNETNVHSHYPEQTALELNTMLNRVLGRTVP